MNVKPLLILVWLLAGSCVVNAQATLVGYYPFNGNAQDYSGKEHHGVVNGCELTCDRFGNDKSAYYFNGNSFISIADNQDFSFGPTDSMSVAAWVKISTDQPDFAGIVVKGPTNTNRPGFQLVILSRFLPAAEATIPNDNFVRLMADRSLYKCSWHFLTVTVSTKRSEVTLYIDGVVAGSVTQPGIDVSYNNNYPIYIGKERNSSVFFTGVIDDVRIYRGILSQNQIRSLYNEKSWPESRRNCGEKDVDTIIKECTELVVLQSRRLKPPYTWSTGINTVSLQINKEGKYWVIGTDDNGCQSMDSFVVVNKYKTDVSIGSDRTICVGDTVNLSAISLPADSSITEYQWYIAPSQLLSTSASITIQPSKTTTYYLKTTSKYGCISTDTVTVTVNPEQSLNTYTESVENIYPGALISIPISFVNSIITKSIDKIKCVIRFKSNSCLIENILTEGTVFSGWNVNNKKTFNDSITFELQSFGSGLVINSFNLALILNVRIFIGDALMCPISAEFQSLNNLPCISYSYNTGLMGIDTSICGLRHRLIEVTQESNMIKIKNNIVQSQIDIEYSHSFDEHVDIKIMNVSGSIVRALLNEKQKNGLYKNSYSISGLSNGLYYCIICIGDKINRLPFLIAH
ncbi:MAG: LamG domain-containing protein [Armatimonadetes bacterium]|nr:LamG domain-containing protein [Armatimonadota bacterium]